MYHIIHFFHFSFILNPVSILILESNIINFHIYLNEIQTTFWNFENSERIIILF